MATSRKPKPGSVFANATQAATSTIAQAVANAAKKPKALSLHLGLNAVDPKAYSGWSGPLAACEFDAHDMAALAKTQGFKATVLLTKQATRAALLKGLRAASSTLKAGDFFFLSFSGHGGQVPDRNRDERDGQDETWCLWDGQLIDDELYLELSKFAAGVRVVMLSDSCHSGTVARGLPPPPPPPGQRPRLMPPAVAARVYSEHRDFYDGLQAAVKKAAGKPLVDPDAALAAVGHVGGAATAAALVGAFPASLVLISGCQDNQTSMDGEHNGAFTEQLLKVWNHGAFKGNYRQLHARIVAGLPPTQSPNLYTLGAASKLIADTPFKV